MPPPVIPFKPGVCKRKRPARWEKASDVPKRKTREMRLVSLVLCSSMGRRVLRKKRRTCAASNASAEACRIPSIIASACIPDPIRAKRFLRRPGLRRPPSKDGGCVRRHCARRFAEGCAQALATGTFAHHVRSRCARRANFTHLAHAFGSVVAGKERKPSLAKKRRFRQRKGLFFLRRAYRVREDSARINGRAWTLIAQPRTSPPPLRALALRPPLAPALPALPSWVSRGAFLSSLRVPKETPC